jgi:hypothetical protein
MVFLRRKTTVHLLMTMTWCIVPAQSSRYRNELTIQLLCHFQSRQGTVSCNRYSALPSARGVCKHPGETPYVSNSFQAWLGGWAKARLGSCLLAGLVVVLPRIARAHDRLGSFVQHTVCLSAGAQHLDVTLDLTFFEAWSGRERKAMDTDGSSSITRSEQEAYLKGIEASAGRQVKLFVGGRELPLALLYPPEIDLLADNRVGPAHHRLRLCFFATTPANLRAGDEIVVEDRLWPLASILVTPQAEGHDGSRLATGRPADADALPGKADPSRRITFKCLQPPSTTPAARADHHRGSATTASEPPGSGQSPTP